MDSVHCLGLSHRPMEAYIGLKQKLRPFLFLPHFINTQWEHSLKEQHPSRQWGQRFLSKSVTMIPSIREHDSFFHKLWPATWLMLLQVRKCLLPKLFHFNNKPWALVFWEEASHSKVNTWHPTPQLDVPAVCRNLLGLIYWCHFTPIPGMLKQSVNVISCEKSKNKPKTLSQRKFGI